VQCVISKLLKRREEGKEERDERKRTLFGSLNNTYLPSGCFNAKSATVRTIPQPFERLTLS
jgi:hypothetical protein